MVQGGSRWWCVYRDGGGVVLVAVVCQSLWRLAGFKLVMSEVVVGNG